MFQVDSGGIVIKINDEGTRWERPTSGRKIRANRRNARKHATGPKSTQGKKRSSRNSVKHGILASGLEPIDRGPFAEDPESFHARAVAIVESLAPRDAIEEVVARQLAGHMNRHERLDHLERAAFESASRLSQTQLTWLRRGEDLGELADWARGLHYYLMGASQPSEVPYRKYAVLMRTNGPKPGQKIRNLWDDEHKPSTEEEWKAAYRTLLKILWPDKEEAAIWAYQLFTRLNDEWAEVEGREREIAADQILNGPFETVTRYRGRLNNDLVRLLGVYEHLQSRKLVVHGSNEPNEEEEEQEDGEVM